MARRSSSRRRQRATPGLGWLAIGLVAYWVYRRLILKIPLTETVAAPAVVLGAVARRRVPDDRGADPADRRVGGGAGRGRSARGRAARDDRARQRDRGAAPPGLADADPGAGAEREPRARRRAGARRELWRARGHAPRARAPAPGRRSSRRSGRGTQSSSWSVRPAGPRARARLRLDGRLRAEGEPGARDGRGGEGRRRESPRGRDPALLAPADRARPCDPRPDRAARRRDRPAVRSYRPGRRRPALCAIADGEEAPGPRAASSGRARWRRSPTARSRSSLYFALGIVAFYALGFTPWVLLAAGLVFMLVALSYAEGTAAIPETGGAATLVRRAFNDPVGFMTGWALFLDYLIVIALAGLFVPHYLGDTVGWDAIKDEPWDVVFGVAVIAADRRDPARAPAEPLPPCDRPGGDRPRRPAPAHHLRLRLLSSPLDAFGKGVDLGTAPTWTSIGFAVPLRCSPIPDWRRSPISPPRRASRARTCRGASSAASVRP